MAVSPPEACIANQLKYLAQHSTFKWEHVRNTAARFNIMFSYCFEQLVWQVEYSLIGGRWTPDFIFPDDNFNPLLPTVGSEGLGPALTDWRIEEDAELHHFMQRISKRFALHQKAVIHRLAANNPQLQFELDTIMGVAGPSKLELLYQSDVPAKAIFAIGIEGLDLSALQPYIAKNWRVQANSHDTIARLGQGVTLKISYPINASRLPTTSLHLPTHLEAIIGRVDMPTWTNGATLVEYISAVQETIRKCCAQSAESGESRQRLLAELQATKFGQAMEIDNVGARAAVFRLNFDGTTWVIHVNIAPGFPDKLPSLVLQRATGDVYEKQYREYPWSPRWSPKEMANRICNFVMDIIVDSEAE